MKNYKLYCLFVFIFLCAQAKAQYLSDYSGRPYFLPTHDDVQGNPLLTDTWFKGTVEFVNGKTAAAVLDYNAYGDELLFKNPKDSSVQAFVDPVKGFTLKDAAIENSDATDFSFSSGFPPVDDQTTKTFYMVVGEGKVKLLKYYKKRVVESQDFTSMIKTKSFLLANAYYLFNNNQMTKIKPTQKNILDALSDKADKMQQYVKTNKVDFKSDVALAKLFSYYNSL
ncbi:hypothetical protein SAMN05192574_10264 [Mucilaginibacter gossypiicola]|uniref:WG containing repeat-containing protein n=1 Tax=Mucilaginibacter gossypiicola TaxID=551995 RepID=A0A1H8CT07_9SPHI|nr:hypothetical protein [Mucilaginibacter gossypiicola]SEM98002.1 hypothetical protein SAMN05192574_10264 [Mucilaginibacter gossypiicola]